jgi:hypothetical protein
VGESEPGLARAVLTIKVYPDCSVSIKQKDTELAARHLKHRLLVAAALGEQVTVI